MTRRILVLGLIAAMCLPLACPWSDGYAPKGSLSIADHERFGREDEPKPGQFTAAELSGRYFHRFRTGLGMVELDLPNNRYRCLVQWSSGRVFVSEWHECLWGGLDSGQPSVLLYDLKHWLILHRQAPGPDGYSITNPLERELSDKECRDHPTLNAGHNIEVNSFGEPIIIMAVDPNIFFAKVRRGETELLEMTGEREQTRNKR